jgi:hypothetical protein
LCYQPAHKASSEEANMRDSRWQAVKWQAESELPLSSVCCT